MSLATRCTACGTVFRVVQDQLKVSEGWVRCGSCNEVFNALEGLFDLERDAPPTFPPAGAEQAVVAVEAPAFDAPADDPSLVDELDARLFPPGPAKADDELPAGTVEPAIAAAPPDDSDASPPESLPAPEFMRLAEREARRQSPRARLVLALATLALALLLALQAAHHSRDLIAARWPRAAPLLAAWCGALGCTIEPLRRIEDISVESTALLRAAGPNETFRLSVQLRNRGGLALALPSVDLALTDTSGQLVARRALAPRDFRAASTVIPPGAEAALQLLLTAGATHVTGYTVEVFYP